MKRATWIIIPFLFLQSSCLNQKNDPVAMAQKYQQAVDDGLAALAKQQAEDGSFGTGQYKGYIAITGLAGLALLSKGPDPEYEEIVAKSVRFILNREDPNRPGFLQNLAPTATHGPMYGHAFAMLFLADAHDAIKDPKLQSDVKEMLGRSVKLLVASQNKEGGWRYQPMAADADLSVTVCQIVALRAAGDLGIPVPAETRDQAVQYVKGCQTKENGGFRYQTWGGAPGFVRTAAALTALNRLGLKDDEVIKKGNEYLQSFDEKVLEPEKAMHAYYGNYYLAKLKWYSGEKDWQEWFPSLRDELIRSQKNDHQWKEGLMCPHYTTSVALIILQMPNQKLPSMKR